MPYLENINPSVANFSWAMDEALDKIQDGRADLAGKITLTHRPLRYERVYLPLCKVADTPFHI